MATQSPPLAVGSATVKRSKAEKQTVAATRRAARTTDAQATSTAAAQHRKNLVALRKQHETAMRAEHARFRQTLSKIASAR